MAYQPFLVRRWLQIECQYILVFHLSQGQLLLQIAHLYILEGKAESPVRRWHQIEFPYTLVVELLALVRLLLQIARLYRMAYQPFLVLPKPLIEHLQPLVPAFQVQQSHQIEFLYILEEEKPAQDLLLLQIECQYILVFHLSQGLQQLPIAHLYILAGKAESPVRRWHQLEFPCTLVVELLALVRLLLQTEFLYRLVYQFSQGQLLHQIAHLYILARKAESPVRRWHRMESPDTQVADLLSRVRRPLRTEFLYILVFWLSQGLQQLQIAHLYILVMRPESQAHLFLQTGVFHSVQLPS